MIVNGLKIGSGANLRSANLRSANLSDADLRSANLSGADLSGADLSGANLSGADLSGANLSGANLIRANLFGANLFGANLSRADLFGANLIRADLRSANLSDADLSGARGILPLPVCDPRGHRAVAIAWSNGWRIKSGCRWFTVAEALEHWNTHEHGDSKIAARYVSAIQWLATQPTSICE